MPYKIDSKKCASCGICTGGCPVMAIVAAGGKYQIDPAKCISCGACVAMCPIAAIAVDAPQPKPAA